MKKTVNSFLKKETFLNLHLIQRSYLGKIFDFLNKCRNVYLMENFDI